MLSHRMSDGLSNRTQRITLPLLCVLMTLLLFIIMMLIVLMSMVLQRQVISVSSQHAWWFYCFMHPTLLKTIMRSLLGGLILSSIVSIVLLCQGEPPTAIREHLWTISRRILIGTVIGTVLLISSLGMFLFNNFFSPGSLLHWVSLQNLVSHLLLDLTPVLFTAGPLSLIGTSVIYTSVELHKRLKSSTLAS
jgi:hypothetical protein